MNAVNPLIRKEEPIHATGPNHRPADSGSAFQQLLSAEIDGRAMPAKLKDANASPAKARPHSHEKPQAPTQDDPSASSKPDDNPSPTVGNASLFPQATLTLATAQPESKPPGSDEDAPNVPTNSLALAPPLLTPENPPAAAVLGTVDVNPAAAAQAGIPSTVSSTVDPTKPLALGQELDSMPFAMGNLGAFPPQLPSSPTGRPTATTAESQTRQNGLPPSMAEPAESSPTDTPPLTHFPASPNTDAPKAGLPAEKGIAPDQPAKTEQATAEVYAGAFNPAMRAAVASPDLNGASHLHPRVGSPDWSHALGDKVVWMVGNTQQTATLNLNPPELGPMRVVLHFNDNQVSANFISAQPEVRAAIEAAMPKLHEMMNNAGLQMGGSNVGSGASNAGMGHSGGQFNQQAWDGKPPTQRGEPVVMMAENPIYSGKGMIDTHA